MISADQILAHLVGDYILQSDWMANEKTKRSVAALAHVLCYSLPFLFFRPSLTAWAFIVATHFVIDRWRLARYVCWAKNFLAPKLRWRYTLVYAGGAWPTESKEIVEIDDSAVPIHKDAIKVSAYSLRNPPFSYCSATGYLPYRPVWLATWLLIITDNTMHLLCNGIALRWM